MTPDSLSIAKEEQKGWSRQDIDYVPVLDLADYLEGKPDAFKKLVEDLRFAQENIGFYYITNHGVDQALIDETFHQVARFHALPLERKLEIRIDTDVTGYFPIGGGGKIKRSEEHTSELQSLMRISYAVFCLKKKYNE